MADNILKLKVESSDYDAKLKKAAEGIRHLADVAHKGGGELTGLEKAELDYIRALGDMETKSRTASGQVRELTNTYKELKVVYNQLNDVEKADEGGKALAASLETIKQRAQEAKKELADVTAELDGTSSGGKGGFLSGLGSKMEGALAVFGGNLMTKAAGAVAQLGSEMADMVKQGVELAKQGEGIRVAFERLGHGDILDGLREATHGTVTDLELMKAAVKFNDFKLPLNELGTMLAFAQQKAKDTGQSVDYMVDSIVTGLGRKSLMILDNLGLSASEIKERMAETGDMTKAVGAIIRDQMSKAGDYVETAADRAQQATVAQQNKMEELGRKIMPLAEESAAMWNSIKIGGLSVIANVLDPMISKFTHLGRLMSAQGMSSNGGGGSMDRMIGMLGTGQGDNARSTYNRQVAAFNRSINARRADVTAVERWQGGERSQGLQETINRLRDKYGADFQRVVRDNLNATINNLNEYKKRAQQVMSSSGAVTSPVSGGTRRTSSPSRQQTEMQKNQAEIAKLTQEYVRLGDSETEASRQRQAEIQKEIQLLEKRNALLGLYQEQAQGRLMGVDVMTGGLSRNGGFTGFATPQSMSDVVRERGGNLLDDKAMKAVNEDISRNLPKEKDSPLESGKKLLSGISQLTDGLEKIGIDIPDEIQSVIGVIQGVMQVIEAVNTIIGVTQATELTANTVAMGLLTEALWANTASSLLPFANGGIVPKFAGGGLIGRAALGIAIPGNSLSGDNLRLPVDGGRGMIGVNSGEVILNRAQQGNLVSQMEGGLNNLHLEASIRGEDIRLAINNNGRRTGRGEFVQSTRRR